MLGVGRSTKIAVNADRLALTVKRMQRLLAAIAWTAIFNAVSLGLSAQQINAENFAIEHVTVINVTTGVRTGDQTVIVHGNRIAAVLPSPLASLASGTQIVDGRGKFLIPGIWDMHTHALFNGARRTLPYLVANGITGTRDMASSFEHVADARKAVDEGLISPRLVISGPGLDGAPPAPALQGLPPGILLVITSPDAGRSIVDRLARAKVDFIKVREKLSRDTYFAIAEEAKRWGLSFSGHLPPDVNIIEASNAGQSPIEHLRGLQDLCAANPAALVGAPPQPIEIDQIKCEETARVLVRNNTWLTPTIGAPGRGNANIRQFNLKITRIAAREGVRLLAGTDWPGYPNFAGIETQSVHGELAGLVEAGLTPVEALQTAISNPAIELNMTHQLGSVESGKLADLLLLDADPLIDISNTRRIAAVVVNGKLIDGPMRQKLLDEDAAIAKHTALK